MFYAPQVFTTASPSLVVALIALFVALGGTALAKVLITGSNIKKGSITGTQIKGNSLGGGQINESSLGTVPNANAVGGKGANSFQAAGKWALIAGTATGVNVLSQSGGISAQRVTTGEYLVNIGSSASNKSLTVTQNALTAGFGVAGPCGGTANNPGGVNCPVINDTNHVIVVTRNTAGPPRTRPSTS